MSLEEKIYSEQDIEHEKQGDFAIIKSKDKPVPTGTELSKEADYLRQSLTQLTDEVRTIITLDGTLGISKTTMAGHMQYWTKAAKILEETNSPDLKLLYFNMGLFGGPFQFGVGFQRITQRKAAEGLTKSVILDRDMRGDKLFVEKYCEDKIISPNMFSYIKKFQDNIISTYEKSNVLIWLKASDKTINERVKERSRSIEVKGKKISLTRKERREMQRRMKDYLEYIERYAPTEFKNYTHGQKGIKIPKVITVQGAPSEYVVSLNHKYEKRFKPILEESKYNGILFEASVDPKDGIDARENLRGQLPIMRGLKNAIILSHLRRGYGVSEKRNGEGFRITPPCKITY